MAVRRIGIIGAGVIGQSVYREIVASGLGEVAYVLVSAVRPRAGMPDAFNAAMTADIEQALSQPVDLVVEAAHPEVLSSIAGRVLERGDLCGFSCAALARPETEEVIARTTRRAGTRFYLPHGAVLGLDGLADGRDSIDEVRITTVKSDLGLGLPSGSSGVMFDGPTRQACLRFPRNVNVHAALAMAGIGFDRTRSVIVAEPGLAEMRHRIEVRGAGMAWDISVSSRSLGGVSGAYTPRSAAGSVRRILGGSGVLNV